MALVSGEVGRGLRLEGKRVNSTMIVTLDAKRRLMVRLVLRRPLPENWLTVVTACPISPDDGPRRRRVPARPRKL